VTEHKDEYISPERQAEIKAFIEDVEADMAEAEARKTPKPTSKADEFNADEFYAAVKLSDQMAWDALGPEKQAEIKAIEAEMKAKGLKVDPETAELLKTYIDLSNPYGIYPEGAAPCVGSGFFARNLGDDDWISFGDLPKETVARLWARVNAAPGELPNPTGAF
jgi:hypothetical protein